MQGMASLTAMPSRRTAAVPAGEQLHAEERHQAGDEQALQPRAASDCANRNPVPKVHIYPEHVFVVLHAPERGDRGHVHYLELDQFVGPDYLITVHGPVNRAVAREAALAETATVRRRLESGRLRPRTPVELSFAVVTAIAFRRS